MAGPTRLTPKKREQFLAALASGGVVKYAAQAIGLSRQTMYELRQSDADFADAWAAAMDDGADELEHEAFRRAVEGVEKPIYHNGVCVDKVYEYSDTLLIFLLKGARPEKFKERQERTISGDVTVRVEYADDSDATAP